MTPAPPPRTGMCCVRVYREASGRIWYRITVNQDIDIQGTEITWVRGRQSEVVDDVVAFLDDSGGSGPAP